MVRGGEVHVIERVERLRPELDALPFPRQFERLRQRQIRVEKWRKP
jgi:hypothetical protein